MAKKNKFAVTLIVLLLLIVVIASAIVYSNKGISIPYVGPTQYWYECNVVINEKYAVGPIGTGEYEIESAKCTKLSTCSSLSFSLFSSQGTLEMWDKTDNRKLAAKDFETGAFSSSETVTIKGCSSNIGNLELRLYDENDNLKQTKVI